MNAPETQRLARLSGPKPATLKTPLPHQGVTGELLGNLGCPDPRTLSCKGNGAFLYMKPATR